MGNPKIPKRIADSVEQRSESDTPFVRGQPHNPEEGDWGDEEDTGGLSDFEIQQIMSED